MRRLFAFFFALFTLLQASMPHAAAETARASVEITSELLRVNPTGALDFGIVLPGSKGGEVKVTPRFRRLISGPVVMLPGLYKPASFIVSGGAHRYYTVETPDTLTFQLRGSAAPALTVKDFSTFSATLGGGEHRGYLNLIGKDLLLIGGTLVVPANARPGHYSGLVPVTVAYQ